ncbi:MAG TPA: energy-coupling factor transporter transmembrane component T [Pleomorphomonadaceae bacterium]|jgi:energy-coupling factor transport system permease protein|nr:energy-coupling factor transporter transmembrane component T [Pleomorphomonadaceae bacterium]
MRAAFAYLGRGSWLARRDPRSILLAAFFFVLGAPQIRDSRHLALILAVAVGYYLLAGIPWRAVRRQWLLLVVVIGAVATINALITGGRSGGFADAETHVLLTLPPFGTEVSAEGISLIATQVLRFGAIAAVGFPVAYAIAPGDLGPALRQLGLGDRMPVMVDLTVRFIPTLSTEFGETIDAQRVRGFDPLRTGGSPMTRLRRLAPLFVPVTVGSLTGAEDTIDAMDLRAFGVGKRTWYRRLQMDTASRVVVGAFAVFLVVATFLNVTGQSEHYLLPFLVR